MNVLGVSLFIFLCSRPLFAQDYPLERETPAPLAEKLCSGAPSFADFWENHVFDAQVEGLSLKPTPGNLLTKSKVAVRAEAFAKSLRYMSYSYGVCPNGNGWVLAFPAPKPIRVLQKRLILEALKDCPKGQAFYSPVDSEEVTRVPLSKGSHEVELNNYRPGSLSLTCTPEQPKWIGSRMWYLIPLNLSLENLDFLPKEAKEDSIEGPEQALFRWVNRVRKKYNLSSLAYERTIEDMATLLGQTKSLDHDLFALEKFRKELEPKGFFFLGENRVKGLSLGDLSRLLWLSPKHKKSLLSPKAMKVGIYTSAIANSGEIFAVLVFGTEKKGITVSKGSSKNSLEIKKIKRLEAL